MVDDSDRVRVRSLVEQQPASDGNGVVEWLNRLCRATSQEVNVLAATITAGPPGESSAVIAVNDPAHRRLAEAEFGVGEGPAHDAWTHRRPVLIPELGGPQDGTWPGYTLTASAAGIRAVYAFPLQIGATRLGVLTLFHDQPGRLSQADLNTCLMMAESATRRLIETSAGAGDGIDASLDAALDFRSEIYQAQGMVAIALGISLIDGLAMMRGHAFQSGRDLIDVANDIVHHGLQLGGNGTIRTQDEDPDYEEE